MIMERTSSTTPAEVARITRCAVCKIDLKRRFTYIDDHTEELLQATREELFGKPFVDSLDPTDQPALNELFARYSRYEATFDAIRVTLVGKAGLRTPVKIIVSMNFIGGSPVNYQIVINPEEASAPLAGAQANYDHESLLAMLTTLVQTGENPDWHTLAPVLRELAGVPAVQVYRAVGKEITCLAKSATAQAPVDQGELIDSIIAGAAAEEFLGNLGDVQAMLPDDELLTEIARGDGERWIFRFRFDAHDNAQRAAAKQQVDVAIGIIRRLTAIHGPSVATVLSAPDWTPILNLFDRAGLGAACVAKDGQISGVNRAFANLFDHRPPTGFIGDMVARLSDCNSADTLESVDTLLRLAHQEGTIVHPVMVELPAGISARMLLHRQPSPDGAPFLWVLLAPVMIRDDSGTPACVEQRFLSDALQAVTSSIEAAGTSTDKLVHEYCGELTREGNFYLTVLGNHLLKLRGMMADLGQTVVLTAETEEMQTCDLKVVVDTVVQEVQSLFPETVITTNYTELPKIITARNKLTAVIRNLMLNSVKFAPGQKVTISISVRAEGGKWLLVISDDGTGIPTKYLNRISEPFYRVPTQKSPAIPGHGTGLAMTRQLIYASGGELSVASEEGQGTQVTITLPQLVQIGGGPDEA